MADSYTANLNLTLPEVGASRDTWGGKVNADMTAIDTVFNAAGNGTSVGLNVGSGKTLTVAGTATVTGTAQFADCSASAPTIAHSGDTNTGVFFPAADTVAITTAGSERARIDSSGNIIVGGTTASAAGLNVAAGYNISFAEGSANTTYTNFFRQSSSGAAVIGYALKYSATANGFASSVGSSFARSAIVADGGVIKLYTDSASTVASGTDITPTERLRIDSSGNVGIGTSSPTSKLVVKTDTDFVVATTVTSGGTGARVAAFNAAQNAYKDLVIDGLNVIYSTQGSERARITSAGLFQVATTSQAGGRVNISGYTNGGLYGMVMQPTANDSTPILFMNAAGTGIGQVSATSTGVTYATSSDYRLKENVQPMQNALATVAQLNPVTYTWKADGSDGQGFIAHELQAVVPDCVTGEKDAVRTVDVLDEDGQKIGTKEEPVYQGVDTSFLVATLTKAIQELKAELDAANARIAALEAK